MTRPSHGFVLRRTLASLALAAAAMAPLAACSPKPDTAAGAAEAAAKPRDVTLSAAQRGHIKLFTVTSSSFHQTVEASGVVDFDNDQATSVISPVSGPVSRLLVNPGQHVAKGQVLALVASPDFATAVATYRKATVSAQNARKLADMDKDLVQHSGVSQREEQQALTDAASADADREAARLALVALGVAPQTIKSIPTGGATAAIEGAIRSPIAGTVVEKLITPGQLLQAGTTASFTVANLSKVWVLAQVSGSDLALVNRGDAAAVDTGQNSLPGVVDNIAALVNPDTRAVAARVLVPNPQGLLKKQMYVRVHIQARKTSNGMLIPVSAVLRDDENLPFVYVSGADGSFARRHVTLGSQVGDSFDIPSGLQVGDRIVVDGGIFVQFMQNQ